MPGLGVWVGCLGVGVGCLGVISECVAGCLGLAFVHISEGGHLGRWGGGLGYRKHACVWLSVNICHGRPNG